MPTSRHRIPAIEQIIREQRQRAQIDAAKHRIAERLSEPDPDPDREEEPSDRDEQTKSTYDDAA